MPAPITLVQTGPDGSICLPGHPDTAFAVSEQGDGSVLLTPLAGASDAEELLAHAAASPTVWRRRPRA